MRKRLSPEDSRAVDLVMDGESMRGGPMYAAVTNGVGQRMEAVERVLTVLDHLPNDDPPADLIGRTMQRIADAENAQTSALPRAVVAPGQRPHA